MGDRANVRFIDNADSKDIYLYTHYDGSELPFIVKATLARKLRWDDPSYLCRIIFCALVRDDVDGELGYGISTYRCDYNYPDTIVNAFERTVQINDKTWTFDGYINTPDEEIKKVYFGEDNCEIPSF